MDPAMGKTPDALAMFLYEDDIPEDRTDTEFFDFQAADGIFSIAKSAASTGSSKAPENYFISVRCR